MLRLLRWLVLGLFGVVVLALAGLWLWWQLDEPLSAEAQAWLAPDRRVVADADNAYLAMLAFDSTAPQPLQRAAQVLERLDALNRESRPVADHEYAAVLADLKRRKPGGTFPDVCKRDSPSCLADLQQPELIALRAQRSQSLARYQAMLAMPQFLNRSPSVILNYAPPFQAHALYDTLIVADVVAGNWRSAWSRWSEQQLFWLRVADHPGDLITLMVANGHLERGVRLLDELLSWRPALAASIDQRGRDALAGSADVSAWLVQAAPGELRFAAHIFKRVTPINALREHGWRSLPEALVITIWLRPNQTINRQQRQLAGELARLGLMRTPDDIADQIACDGPVQWWTADWANELMVCAGAGDWSRYQQRLERLQRHSQAVLERLGRVNGAGNDRRAVQ
ncbi:MAG TPA: hypothetical protein VLC08_03265 [Chitinolyticbacter sp.]|nr:hypothetical protein [Chitinolyticbacter sp.]